MMSEMRNYMETEVSNLFTSKFPLHLVRQLHSLYLSSKGKSTKNKVHVGKLKGETGSDVVRRLMANYMKRIGNGSGGRSRSGSRGQEEPSFRTFLIDEAHFLKNLESFWGMFASCIGAVTDKYTYMHTYNVYLNTFSLYYVMYIKINVWVYSV